MLSVILGPLLNGGLIIFPVILFIGVIIHELINDPEPYLAFFGAIILGTLIYITAYIILYPIGKLVGWILVQLLF